MIRPHQFASAMLLAAALASMPATAAPAAPAPAKSTKAATKAKSPPKRVTSPYARAAEQQARGPQAVGGLSPTPGQAAATARAHSPRATAKRH